jgi:microcin C transport system substrate-binding protein
VLLASVGTGVCEPLHGLSAFGDLELPPNFQHFRYADPDAPKGGRLSQIGTGALLTFDSFNGFILRGDAAQGLELLFDSLMTRAADEPDAMYGLVARTADLAADHRSVTFELREEARFADGTPVTAADVCFSFETLKKRGHPQYRTMLRDVVACEGDGPLVARYRFQGDALRDLPLTVAALPVLSKAYYTANNFDETSLKPPLGSGPYRIGDFKQGTFVSYRRRPDYWAKDLPVNRGRFNFDEVRYDYFRDRTAALESFKAGDYDLREEFTARDWATAYDIPQVRDGRVQKLVLPDESPSGTQGFFLNMRRAKFQDARVRRALDLAFDFEWMNNNLFYGLYTRTTSYFENSDLKATGKPEGAEFALLDDMRDLVPPEVFGPAYVPPVSDGSGTDRKRLQQAVQLLAAAGYAMRTEAVDDPDCGTLCRATRAIGLGSAPTEQVLRNAKGEPLEIEFLSYEPTFERILNPYVQSLRLIGIRATVRRVDAAQYERRVKSFDFDIVTTRFVMRLTPGSELVSFFGSETANVEGTYNRSGIASPAVDRLIAKVQEAHTRAELVNAARALDRVLRAGYYWIPHWYKASYHLAFWDKFGRPAMKPKYARGILDTWWFDPEKAARLKAQRPT